MIMEGLVISPDFTTLDTHKIIKSNYERTKDITVAEKAAYYNSSGFSIEDYSEFLLYAKLKIMVTYVFGIRIE